MTKAELRKIIGANIRKERKELNISRAELASKLKLTPAYVGLIERGQRGTSSAILFNLADIFGIPVDSLLLPDNSKEKLDLTDKRAALSNLISDCSDSELDFVISIIKHFRDMQR